MNGFRNSALLGLTLGFVGFCALTGVAFYNGVKSTAKIAAPVFVPHNVRATTRVTIQYAADEFPEVNRDSKRNLGDLTPPYYGRVLSFDNSKVF